MGAPFSGGEVHGPAFNDMAGGCSLSCHRCCTLIAAAGIIVTATADVERRQESLDMMISRSLHAYLTYCRSAHCQAGVPTPRLGSRELASREPLHLCP